MPDSRRIALALFLAVAISSPAAASLGVGEAAPDFTLLHFAGGSHSLSEYAGQVVVLFFVGYG